MRKTRLHATTWYGYFSSKVESSKARIISYALRQPALAKVSRVAQENLNVQILVTHHKLKHNLLSAEVPPLH